MKKRFWVLVAAGILVVALAAPAAFGAIAGNGQGDQSQQFYNQMFDWHQKWLDQAQEDGQVTPEQAKAWQDHFNYMREFHSQNGFGPMGNMMGGGGFNGMMGGSGYGFGGMMNWGNTDNQ
ncbi:MAG: hypothetical protein JL50_10010 [Peptococcaceae bacterium BICA1-7]|nr:MAG: hypothetical protein JL50_10010 [Peptococcaceae bacterium BICA1-7]HBV95616.1 hypothetical protein [Desulfotomaculum sp.]